jgi:hypothetical protein
LIKYYTVESYNGTITNSQNISDSYLKLEILGVFLFLNFSHDARNASSVLEVSHGTNIIWLLDKYSANRATTLRNIALRFTIENSELNMNEI